MYLHGLATRYSSTVHGVEMRLGTGGKVVEAEQPGSQRLHKEFYLYFPSLAVLFPSELYISFYS